MQFDFNQSNTCQFTITYKKREQKIIARNIKVTIFCPEIFEEKSSFLDIFLSKSSEKLKNV